MFVLMAIHCPDFKLIAVANQIRSLCLWLRLSNAFTNQLCFESIQFQPDHAMSSVLPRSYEGTHLDNLAKLSNVVLAREDILKATLHWQTDDIDQISLDDPHILHSATH